MLSSSFLYILLLLWNYILSLPIMVWCILIHILFPSIFFWTDVLCSWNEFCRLVMAGGPILRFPSYVNNFMPSSESFLNNLSPSLKVKLSFIRLYLARFFNSLTFYFIVFLLFILIIQNFWIMFFFCLRIQGEVNSIHWLPL